jgi:transposase
VAKASAKKTAAKEDEPREVLDVVRELLAKGRADDVLGVVSSLIAKNTELERRLAQLLARGRKNEGISAAQLLLFLNDLARGEIANDDGGEDGDDAGDTADANTKLREASGIDDEKDEDPETKPERQPPVRKPPPANLPRVDNPIPVAAEERPCPTCGKERRCIGHDVSEVYELVPAKLVVRRDIREKLACEQCDGEIVRAPTGDKVVAGGRLGARLVSEIVVDKYDDGLPLHRQKGRIFRLGLDISVSTLADQIAWATELLRPLWRAAMAQVLVAKVMHLDATSLPVLDREAETGKRLGSLWGYVGDRDVAVYVYTSTGRKSGQREQELGPEDMLALRSGFTVADASNVFETSFKRPDLIECGCNMHARRYFVKALDAGDMRAALPIAAYKKLYAIEAEIADLPATEKLAARQEKSKRVFDEIVSWCKVYKPREPPASLLGAAIRYLLNHQLALGRFLEAAEIPIDNGIVERLHVRAALTRKNFLFAGSDTGGDRAAIAFTILSCCRLVGVNPVDYLADVLPRLSRRVRIRDLPDLLPAKWKADRESAAST